MSFSSTPIASVHPGTGSANAVTTSGTPIDTTGAVLLTVFVYHYLPGTTPTLVDSKSNTFTLRGTVTQGNYVMRLFDCIGGTVGTGHYFDVSGTGSYPSIGVMAWSEGSNAASFDQLTAATEGTLTEVTVGPLTPSNINGLFVTGWCNDTGNEAFLTIDSGFTLESGVGLGSAHAYFVQGSPAAAKSPKWDGTNWTNYAALLATYLPSGGGGGPTGWGPLLGDQRNRLVVPQ